MVDNGFLLVAYFFAPHRIVGAKRFSLFSSVLSAENRNVHVITIDEKYLEEKDFSTPYGGVIYRTKVFPYFPRDTKKKINRIINRIIKKITPIDEYSGWIIPALIKGLNVINRNKINQIIVTGPPFSSFMIGYVLSLLFKKKLILDYQDPWFLYRSRNLRNKINLYLEKKILARADIIIFNTEKAKEKYSKIIEGLENKSFVVPNPYIELEDIEAVPLDKMKKVFLYSGNFYGGRRLSYVVEPLKKIILKGFLSSEKVSIHIFGNVLKEDMEEFVKNGLAYIIIQHEKVDYYLMLKYMKSADILLLLQGEDYECSVPYKLIDYLSIKRPILAITSKGSATQSLMEEVNCGEVGFINESESIYIALKKLIMNSNQYSFNGIEKYSLNTVVNNYLHILDTNL